MSTKKILMILALLAGGFVIFIGLLVALVFYATSGVTDTVRDQLSAIREGNLQKAYSYTSSDFQQATSFEQFEEYVKAYPAISQNVDSTFTNRSIENNTGKVKGYVTNSDGSTTNVEYMLIKENGQWKILNMRINPEGAGIEKGHSSDAEGSSVSLMNFYESKENQYSIRYPKNWEYTKPDKATVVIGGKQGSPDYDSTVNIQTVLTKQVGGKYMDVDEFMQSLKNQAFEQATDTEILSEDPINIEATSNSIGMEGRFMIFTYTYQGTKFKQLQFVFERGDEQAFYAWAYTSPLERYEIDYPIAKAMFDSWSVH